MSDEHADRLERMVRERLGIPEPEPPPSKPATVHSTAQGFLGAPSGMSLGDFAKHPVRQAIREAAVYGERAIPSAADLDQLDLSAADRSAVKKAAKDAAEVHGSGNQSEAWALADERAAAIVDGLDDRRRDPTYLDAPTEPDPTDPRELAARVSPRF